MERKPMQVYASIKNIVQDLKSTLKVKNESEVIGYLFALYEERYPKITLVEHENAIRRMKDLLNQETI